MSIQEAVQQVVSGGSAAVAETGTAAILSALREGTQNVLSLVGLLKGPLTDEQNHEARAQAVQLLSQVASDVPEALQVGDVGVMADFLSAKLQDWRCVDAAVPGCLNLMQRYQHHRLAPLPEAAALQLITRFLTVHVQGLVYKGRITCYQLLLEILQGPYAVAAVLGGNNLVELTVVAMENEADPRCLLIALQCVQAVGRLYQQPALSSITHLDDGLEDLFDVGVVPYFPMMFTPPKNDNNNITRDELLGRVVDAMACCPQFAALGVPLLSEKLGSSLRQAKSDSLVALPVCLRGWGPAAVKPHLQAIWLMLKAELMGPATAEGITPDQLSTKHTAATAAAAALTQCITASGHGLLDQRALNDVAVEDLMQYMGLVNPPWSQEIKDESSAGSAVTAAAAAAWDLPEKAQKRLVCIARFVAAVAAAGGSSCNAVCSNILKPAVAAVSEDTAAAAAAGVSHSSGPLRPVQANCAVFCVLHSVLKAVNAAAAAAAEADAFAAISSLVPTIADVVIALQQQLQANSMSSSSEVLKNAGDAEQAEQLRVWVLLLWQDLLSLHHNPPLQQQQLDTAAQQLVQLALSDSSSVKLDLDIDGSSSSRMHSVAAAGVAALTKMAAWSAANAAAAAAATSAGDSLPSGMQAVQQYAVPSLLEASSSSSDKERRFRALGVLQKVAGSSAAAAWEVIVWLQPLILAQLQHGDMVSVCSLLTVLHSYAIPALADDLDPQHSTAAAAFADALLQSWQQQQQQLTGDASEVHNAQYDSCLLLAQLVAKCSSKDQQLLMLTACEWIATAAAAATGSAAAVPGPAALAAAVISAARPGVLTASSTADLAGALATICTASNSSSSSSLDKAVSGIAVASVVHKCIVYNDSSSGGSSSSSFHASPDAVLAAALPLLLLPVQRRTAAAAAAAGDDDDLLGALQALAWLSRGLAMQRHDGWLQCMQEVLLLLPPLSMSTTAAERLVTDAVYDAELLWAAAGLFSTLVTSLAPPAAVGNKAVSKQQQQQQQQQELSSQCRLATISHTGMSFRLNLHWTARPLWQQKAFTLALEAVSTAGSSSNSGPAAAAASAGEQRGQQSSLGLQLAAASLISAAPAAVSDAAKPQVVPLLLQSLVKLSEAAPGMLLAAPEAAGNLLRLLHDCLLLVGDWVMAAADKAVQELLTPHVEQILTVLCQLARLTLPAVITADIHAGQQQQQQSTRAALVSAAAAVREVALMNLTGMTGLPYHLLHPYRRQVLATVTAALDDDRRAVRKAAVVCRTSWTVS